MKFISILSTLVVSTFGIAQESEPRYNPDIDVLDYNMLITLTNSSNEISLESLITISFQNDVKTFILDLEAKDSTGKGMSVTQVLEDGEIENNFEQLGEQLIIHPHLGNKGEAHFYLIFCEGIPKDGLVIGTNKHGNRTFFGDNWPNRAHQWFPCVDHPSDKATVRFSVDTPPEYSTVANGALEKHTILAGGANRTVYKSTHPLPTKVMVIGVAELVSEELSNTRDTKVVNWVYPEDREAGFNDMRVALDPLNFYIDKVAPYPFDKLYNVQSTTRFGGMENAGCIFYDEDAVKGDNSMENLIAHEIAHQWFGNSASEADWPHIWLSEGFATYFTSLHLENKYGREHMNEQLIKDRKRVVKFAQSYQTPVIDTLSEDLMFLLNPNSYQKGCWFLHMLRTKMGDEAFWKGIQSYYTNFQYSNATTDQFMREMEAASQLDLKSFFDQWLRTPGHPQLNIELIGKKKNQRVHITQTQEHIFDFPLEIKLNFKDRNELVVIDVNQKEMDIPLGFNERIIAIEADPGVKLLFEEMAKDL